MFGYNKSIIKHFKTNVRNKSLFFASLILSLLSSLFWVFHYLKIFYGNYYSWRLFLLASLLLICSFTDFKRHKTYKFKLEKRTLFLALFLTLLYWTTHLWNFYSAPWNSYGLFDDAAWDIYFAKNHAFNGILQPAFFDNVGYISREVVFHYYISVFFKTFGYNLLVFNFSLLLLGFVTVFFTSFIVDSLFNKNTPVTVISALLINFLPFHFMHIFMGHRYAICAPLMVLSLFFLFRSFAKKSFFEGSLSAMFAALCWDSSIMGKQYIAGLLLAFVLKLLFGKTEKKWLSLWLAWIVSFLVFAMPLIIYIVFNYREYSLREKNLMADFLVLLKSGGIDAVTPYYQGTLNLFLSKINYSRQFLPDFYLIPKSYFLLLIPGYYFAIKKKFFIVVILSLLPVLATLISGAYDFRVLLAVPLWIILISTFLDFIWKNRKLIILRYIVIVIVVAGLYPSISYIYKVSSDANYLYLLPHKDVAVSRLVRSITAGDFEVSASIKKNEFKSGSNGKVNYDTLFCPYSAYAIAHLYLQDFEDKKVLSLCNQGIQLLKTPEEILGEGKKSILDYQINNKDLKLVWEVSKKSEKTINFFSQYEIYGTPQFLYGNVDGVSYSLFILTVKKDMLENFKSDIYKSGLI